MALSPTGATIIGLGGCERDQARLESPREFLSRRSRGPAGPSRSSCTKIVLKAMSVAPLFAENICGSAPFGCHASAITERRQRYHGSVAEHRQDREAEKEGHARDQHGKRDDNVPTQHDERRTGQDATAVQGGAAPAFREAFNSKRDRGAGCLFVVAGRGPEMRRDLRKLVLRKIGNGCIAWIRTRSRMSA